MNKHFRALSSGFRRKRGNGGIEFRQGKEALIEQTRQNPALSDLDSDLNFGLVLCPR